MRPDIPLRIAFFGVDGALSLTALGTLARAHRIVAIVRPRRTAPTPAPRRLSRRLLGAAARGVGLLPPGSLAEYATALGAPMWEAVAGEDSAIAARVRESRPDLVCIVGYPWLLRGEIVTDPPAMTLNLHSALLPRHRGPLPLFWIYFHDDRRTGVTVHHISERADAGDILGQDAFALARGLPVEELNRRNADLGARLLERVLSGVAAGRTVPAPQDETAATLAPRVPAGRRMIDFEQWNVERVWHFMAGLYPRFIEPLRAEDGTSVHYRGVLGYERGAATKQAGVVTPASHGWDLHCLGGRVRLRR